MTLLLEMRIVMNCPLPMVDCPPRLQGLAKTCKDTAEVKARCCLSLGVHVLSSWPSTVPNIASLGATSTSPRYHFQGGGCPDQNGHQPHPPPPRGVIIASYCIRDIMRYCNMVLLKTTVYTVWLWPAAHGIGRKLAILRFTRQRRHRAALLKPGFNGRFGIPYTPSSAIASPMSYYCSCYFRLHKPLPFFSLSISLSLSPISGRSAEPLPSFGLAFFPFWNYLAWWINVGTPVVAQCWSTSQWTKVWLQTAPSQPVPSPSKGPCLLSPTLD